MKRDRKILIVVIMGLLSGCSIVNPYESESLCGRTDYGRCMNLRQAYAESMQESDKGKGEEKTASGYVKKEYLYKKGGGRLLDHGSRKRLIYRYIPVKIVKKKETEKEKYRKEKYRTLRELISKTEKPLVAPPKILKVLILPYSTGERSDTLNMQRVVFLKVEDSRWIFDPVEVE